MKRVFLFALPLAVICAVTAGADNHQPLVEVAGSELLVHVGRDKVLRGTDLVGAKLDVTLDDGIAFSVRIDTVTPDPRSAFDDVMIYGLSTRTPEGTWVPVCEPDPYGENHAILQPARDGALAIWCTGGTHAKCIRFGYRPWASGPHGEPLAPYHLACSKMLRADYCGDDQATTRTGMLVDIYDRLGIIEPTPSSGTDGLTFEAAWSEDRALCVAHPRVPQNVSLERLAETCPRLQGRLGAVCTEEAASQFGRPLIFNASRGDGIIETK